MTDRHRRLAPQHCVVLDLRGCRARVDWLADHGFAVERSAIVGTGLRSVEQVTGRMTPARAATIGAGQGALIGALFALFGIFFTGPEFVELLLYSLALGALFGALYGALAQYAASGGRRDFVSTPSIQANRYDVQVDEEAADQAMRVLGGMTGHADGGHHRRASLQ